MVGEMTDVFVYAEPELYTPPVGYEGADVVFAAGTNWAEETEVYERLKLDAELVTLRILLLLLPLAEL